MTSALRLNIPTEYPIDAVMGMIPGTITGSRVGSNDNVPSSTAIILSNVTSASFPSNQPTTAQQMQVVSSSANDTASGIGVQQITITYLTAPFPINTIEPFKKKTEIVTLNGTTPVNTMATDIYRIDRFSPNRVGSTGIAAGNISLQSVGGATTFEQVRAARTSGETVAHYIPKGFGTIITDLSFGCSTAGGAIAFLIATEIDPSGNRVGIGQLQVEIASAAVARTFVTPKFANNPDGRETFVLLAVQGRASNQTVSASFGFIDFPLPINK